MYTKNVTFATIDSWAKYLDTGDVRFLDDAASLVTLDKGTHVVIAGEGWDREAILS